MKTLVHTILLSMILSSGARAENPPPLPPNPFGNLPSSPNADFNPFDEEGDESDFEGDFDEPQTMPVRPGAARPAGANNANSGSNAGGGFSPSRPNNNGAPRPPRNRNQGNNEGNSEAHERVQPANCKDIVENFDYPDAEILDVAKAIAKLTGKNFIYNPQDVKGRISIVSETPITVCDAWNSFLTALNMKTFALVPSGKYLRIERVASAKEKQTPIYADKKPPNNDEFITRVVPLRYIDATEFEQTFRLWMPREARMQAYSQTNTLIITDTAAHINRMMQLIGLLDVAGYQESLVVVPIRNATAKDIARLIEQILNDKSSSNQGFGAPRPAANPFGQAVKTQGRTGGSVISKIIADDRTNSLIVKANAAGIQEIRILVRRLDTKIAANAQSSGRIHVIHLQFADAETLAKSLSPILSGGNKSSQANRNFTPFGNAIPDASVFQSEIKVAPDKTTQSLIVTASPQDFATFKNVVESLDVPRDQVFIEALIMEVNLNRDNSYGTSFVSAPNGIALPSASGALTNLITGNPIQNGFVLGFKKGVDRGGSITVGGQKVDTHFNTLNGLIEMIQGNTDSNIIATPKIIAMDNEKATFELIESVPVLSTTSTATSVSQNFTQDKATLSLVVTPQINRASNFVKLDIDQKIENFDNSKVPTALANQATGRSARNTATKVFVQNEDTVVLSGLIKDTVQEITKKVPLLGDIPILGWLFKNTSSEVRKTNLLVFITPRIIKQYDALRKVFNRNLEQRDDFIRENLGSKDPMAKHIAKLRSDLPDLTVIEPLPQSKPMESTTFATPSSPDRDYDDGNNGYYDNGFYPDNSVIPLDQVNNPMPNIGNDQPMPGQDNSPAPIVLPDPNQQQQ